MTIINRIKHAGSLAARLATGTALGVGLFAAVAGTPDFALAQEAAPSQGPPCGSSLTPTPPSICSAPSTC